MSLNDKKEDNRDEQNDETGESTGQQQQLPLLSLIGGTSVDEDLRLFKENGANIIVATPGRFVITIISFHMLFYVMLICSFMSCRLEDIFRRLSQLIGFCKELSMLILDEADRLLDLGFERSIKVCTGEGSR